MTRLHRGDRRHAADHSDCCWRFFRTLGVFGNLLQTLARGFGLSRCQTIAVLRTGATSECTSEGSPHRDTFQMLTSSLSIGKTPMIR
jgi:hypothetical protein